MNESGRRKGLGRGLAALIEDTRPVVEGAERKAGEAKLPLDRIHPNPDQPRKRFDEEELESLAASIRARGVVQPLIVRPEPGEGGGWQIVAGERRWRAAQRAGLHEVPAVIREMDDVAVLEVAIVENIQRSDLNAIEEASGYAQLQSRFGHSQAELAEALGKSRSHVANMLRLLTLPPEVLQLARDGSLSAGHARALVVARDPEALARIVVARGLSVRETEKLVKAAEAAHDKEKPARAGKDPDTLSLESDLSAALGLKVAISHRGAKGGELRVSYRSLEELDGLCQLLSSNNQ